MPKHPVEAEYLSTAEAAKMLSISTKTLRTMAFDAGIPIYRPTPGIIRFKKTELEAHMQAHKF